MEDPDLRQDESIQSDDGPDLQEFIPKGEPEDQDDDYQNDNDCCAIDPDLTQDQDHIMSSDGRLIKKRKSYANSFKLEAIALAEKMGNRRAAKQLGLDESNVREWRKRKDEIQKLPTHKRSKRHAKPKWIDLETQLAEWFLDRKNKNLYVTTNMVKEKGMELANEYGYEDFSGSSGWVTRFLNRVRENGGDFGKYTLTGRKKPTETPQPLQPQIPPEFVERVHVFRSFFAEKRAQSELKRRNGIITLDEVPFALDMPSVEGQSRFPSQGGSNGGVSGETSSSAIPPAEKVKLTVVLSASAAGGKLPPLVIFKGKNLPKEAALVFPDGVVVRANDKGWINPHLIEDWIENCWKKWLWPSRSEDNVLVLDSCKSHVSQELKFKCSKHFQTLFIARGMSQYLHPLELTVTKSFRENVLKQWEQWVLDQACGGIDDDDRDESYSKRVENYLTICQWILEAWRDINPQVIMNGFAKAGIESFSPEEVVEAILNDNGETHEPESSLQSSSNQMLFPDYENYIGDDFDGWD